MTRFVAVIDAPQQKHQNGVVGGIIDHKNRIQDASFAMLRPTHDYYRETQIGRCVVEPIERVFDLLKLPIRLFPPHPTVPTNEGNVVMQERPLTSAFVVSITLVMSNVKIRLWIKVMYTAQVWTRSVVSLSGSR